MKRMCRQEKNDGGLRVGHSVFISRFSLRGFGVSAFQAGRVSRQFEICVCPDLFGGQMLPEQRGGGVGSAD